MRITKVGGQKEFEEFAKRAAKDFELNGHHWSYTDDDIIEGSLFALRWGGYSDCVLVFRIGYAFEPIVYEELIEKKPKGTWKYIHTKDYEWHYRYFCQKCGKENWVGTNKAEMSVCCNEILVWARKLIKVDNKELPGSCAFKFEHNLSFPCHSGKHCSCGKHKPT